MNKGIPGQPSYPAKYLEVYGSKMHYVDVGEGDPILFLHGVPTSSYLWRNIIPHLMPLGRCLAPDFMGFGWSDKPNIDYSIFDHIKYVEKFIDLLNLKNITFVMHGWGSIIGFHYAMQHPENCKGLAFYEAFLRSSDANDVSLPFQEQLINWQDQENLYNIAINGATFVDTIIPQNVMRQLTNEEMNHYRFPFLQEGTGKPILRYLQELPTGDNKNEVEKLIAEYSEKLTHSSLPKLMLYSIPGFITTIATIMWAKEYLPHLEIVDLGEELHLAQESNPELIGKAISVWLQGVEQHK